MNVSRISVLICTYNRAELLRQTLAAFQGMDVPPACEVEILIVDNNSADHTSAVVAEASVGISGTLTYLFEPRQGKSFALNLGLCHARGDVIALTDDDVLPARDWLVRIVSAFRERDVTFVFGKVLPHWGCLPPPELLTARAQDIWGPLALLDYGDVETEYDVQKAGQRLPIGANLAFDKTAIAKAGGWRTDLGKVDDTLISGEDHEIFIRLKRMNLFRGLYDPANFVKHRVPSARLTRAYFRRWFLWHGRTHARMLDELFPDLDLSRVPRIGGVPRFVYRQGLQQIGRYTHALPRLSALDILIEELRTIEYLGFFLECWRLRAGRGRVHGGGRA
jgi:glycosyltransferase involved in cell wall biosynthesis